jgi:hypothetical protein
MNSLKVIQNLLDENLDEFKNNVNSIIEKKLEENKINSAFEIVEGIFKHENNLNTNGILHLNVVEVLQESIKQGSNITLELSDLSEVTLKPHQSKKVLRVFDDIHEENQKSLLENLISSKVGFEKSIDFCSKYKRKAK